MDNIERQYNDLEAFPTSTDMADVVVKKAFFNKPVLGTATYVLAATDLADGDVTEVTEGITNPDVPRILSVTGGAATCAGTVTIEGFDFVNNAISEDFELNGTTEVFGEKAFKVVSKITLPAFVASGETVSVGTGDKLGLKEVVKDGAVLMAFADDVEEVTKPTITKNPSILAKNVIDFNTAPDGSVNFTCYFLDK
jgi:hypothetical protein